MKRTLCLLLCAAALLCALSAAAAEGGSEKALTLMIYMCGTNLESQYGSATADIQEILASGVDTRAVNVVLMTGGAQSWQLGLDPERITVSDVVRGQLRTVLQEDAMNMGEPDTLAELLRCGLERYPARDYALILWDHGAGPLGGVCMDELNDMDRLSLGEIAEALERVSLPKKLSWIGFDACLMSSAEVARAVAPFAEYMIASQATEPAAGWGYGFLQGVEADTDGAATGRRIVDAYFDGENREVAGLTLACLDLSAIEGVSAAMDAFFDPLSKGMDVKTFAALAELRMASAGFGEGIRGISENGYDLVDLGDLIAHCASLGDTSALEAALDAAVVYRRSGLEDSSGLSVYHPLHNKESYLEGWKESYGALGFSAGYNRYLDAFGALLTGRVLADWSNIRLEDDGFGADGQNLFSLLLEQAQLEDFASAQLIVLGMKETNYGGEYDAQLSVSGAPTANDVLYYPVSVTEAAVDGEGRITAGYAGRSVYLMDDAGQVAAGPIGYRLSDDGRYWYFRADFYDNRGLEKRAPSIKALFTCELDEATGMLNVVNTEVYDEASKTYTRRIAFDEADYTDVWFLNMSRVMPEEAGVLPAFADWEAYDATPVMLSLPLDWHFQLVDAQLSGVPLYATLEVTDLQQNRYCTPLVRVQNPNLYDIGITPRTFVTDDYELTLYAVLDSSEVNAGLSVGAEVLNTSDRAAYYNCSAFVVNGSRTIKDDFNLYLTTVQPGERGYNTVRIDAAALTGLGEITSLEFEVEERSDSAPREENLTPMRFELTGCDASGLPQAEDLLAEHTVNGVTWQLVSLEKNAQGGLTGLLHVVNATDERYVRYGNAAVNGVVQTEDQIRVEVAPNTDAYVPFTISNRAITAYSLSVQGVEGSHFLAVYNLLERFGVERVEEITLCMGLSYLEDTVRLTLKEPLPFATAEEVRRAMEAAEAEAGEPRLLLDAAVTANVDRVLVGENGVALRLVLRNNADRLIQLEIGHPAFNGVDIGDAFDDSYAIAPGATVITCVNAKLSGDCVVEPIDDVGFTFRYDNYTTNRAHVRLNGPVSMDAEGGTYLSPEDFTTVPAPRGRPEDAVFLTDVPEGGLCAIDVGLDVTNVEHFGDDAPEDYGLSRTAAKLAFHVENLSDRSAEYRLEDIVLNGVRSIGERVFTMKVAPGEAYDKNTELDLSGFIGLDVLTSLDCTLWVERESDWAHRERYALHVDVENCPLAALRAGEEGAILAEAEALGALWRLCALEEDETGALNGLLYVRNDGTEALAFRDCRARVEGVLTGEDFELALPAGKERYVSFSFANRAGADRYFTALGAALPEDFEGRVLQRLGVGEVREFALLLGFDDAAGRVAASVPLALDAPLSLAAASGAEGGDLRGGAALLEGDVSVRAAGAVPGDGAIALMLVMENATGEDVCLAPFAPDIGGMCAAIGVGRNSGSSRTMLVPAHATRVETVRIETGDSFEPGEALAPLTLSFLADDVMYDDAVVDFGPEAVVGSGARIPAGALEAVPAGEGREAPAVYERVGLPRPEAVKPVRLVAPVDAERAANFDYGYVLVCMEDAQSYKDGDGGRVEMSGLRGLFFASLAAGEEGPWADYSGMVMLADGDRTMHTTELYHEGEKVLAAQTYLYGRTPENEPSGEGVAVTWYWTVEQSPEDLALTLLGVQLEDTVTGGEADDMPGLSQLWSVGVTRPMYYLDAMEHNSNGLYYLLDRTAPVRLVLVPAESLDAKLTVIYELHYADGTSELIEREYGEEIEN